MGSMKELHGIKTLLTKIKDKDKDFDDFEEHKHTLTMR